MGVCVSRIRSCELPPDPLVHSAAPNMRTPRCVVPRTKIGGWRGYHKIVPVALREDIFDHMALDVC